MPFWWQCWQVLASVLARKNRLKSRRCHAWRKLSGKNGRAEFSKQKKKKADERERNWNVNESYRIVNWKVKKSAKRRDKWQFMHSSIAEHYYYIYIYYILYYLLKSIRELHFRSHFLQIFARPDAPPCHFMWFVSPMLRLCMVTVKSWAGHLLTFL